MAVDPLRHPYVDTSALAKRYLDEPYSDELDSYLGEFPWVAISTLTQVEMHCLLARRRRYLELTPDDESKIRSAMQEDIELGFLRVLPVENLQLQLALRLLDSLAEHSLRTLDALHLAVVESSGHRVLATADSKMSAAALHLGLEIEAFC